MRSKLAKAVRKEFNAYLKLELPQFRPVKPKEIEFLGKLEREIPLGFRLYLWDFKEDLYFYLLLVIATPKMGDGFTVEGAWTRNGRFPSTTIKKQFVWTKIVSPKNVRLDLQSAKVGEFLDDEESWPAKDMLNVAGLVYDSIADMDRRKWLRLQREFQHQPYEQLASILRKHGRDEEARKVLIVKARERARRKQMSSFERAYHNLLGLTIGYGYLPWRAFRISVVMVLVGWIIFALGYHNGMIMKTKEMEYVSVREEKKPEMNQPVKASEDYPKFDALVYSLDAFVPLVDLHQATYWLPNVKFGDKLFGSELFEMSMPTGGDLLRLYMWFHILSGWILTTLLFVGLSGFVKR